MSSYTVTPEELPDALMREFERVGGLVMTGLELGAERARVAAIRATPVDQGDARRGWEVKRFEREVELRNDAPYAQVLEEGRRPGQRPPPFDPILEWVRRHADELGVGNARSLISQHRTIGALASEVATHREYYEVDPDEDMIETALGIQRAIGARGLKPHFIIGSRLETFGRWAEDEVRKLLRRA